MIKYLEDLSSEQKLKAALAFVKSSLSIKWTTLCKGYRRAGDSKQHRTLPVITHHGPFEGIYTTGWKSPLRAKLLHTQRWVFMVIGSKTRPVVGRNALGCAGGPTARTNPGIRCLAPGNGTWPTPGKKWGSLQGRCSQEETRSWSHLQIQGAHPHCFYQASPYCDHQSKSPSKWAVGTVSCQPASSRPYNYGLLLLHGY